jgi:hypothetical protein
MTIFCKRILLGIFSLAFLFSCKSKVSIEEFTKEISEDEDFVKVYQDSTFKASCTYLPPEYLALSEVRSIKDRNGNVSSEQFNLIKSKYSNATYFLFKLGLSNREDILRFGISSKHDYAVRINDISFNSTRNAYILKPNEDTIKASIADLQRSYGMSPDMSILFAFPIEQVVNSNHKKFRFIYQDRYFGIQKPISFLFDTKALTKKLPVINFENHE